MRISLSIRTILALSCTCVCAPAASWAHEGLHHDIERETQRLDENPSDVEALLRRAHYYRLDAQPQNALDDLQRATRLAPEDARLHFEKGFVLAALGRDAEAEAELSAFIAQSEGSAAAYEERARVRARTGRPELAIDDFDAAIALAPTIDLYLERGELLEGRARYADAAEGYRDGLARLGDSPLLQRALVAALIAAGRFDEALRAIDDALEAGVLATQWLLERATVLEHMGRSEEAREARLRALSKANASLHRHPTSTNLVARAEVHLALGDAAAAQRDLEQALRNSPQLESAKAMLAAIRAKADDRAAQEESR